MCSQNNQWSNTRKRKYFATGVPNQMLITRAIESHRHTIFVVLLTLLNKNDPCNPIVKAKIKLCNLFQEGTLGWLSKVQLPQIFDKILFVTTIPLCSPIYENGQMYEIFHSNEGLHRKMFEILWFGSTHLRFYTIKWSHGSFLRSPEQKLCQTTLRSIRRILFPKCR